MKTLPYRAETATGDVFDFEFPLHDDTGDAVRVSQIVSAILETLDRDIAVMGETSNGDVLQAIAMAMAIRSRMIHASSATVAQLATELLQTALAASADTPRQGPDVGHA